MHIVEKVAAACVLLISQIMVVSAVLI